MKIIAFLFVRLSLAFPFLFRYRHSLGLKSSGFALLEKAALISLRKELAVEFIRKSNEVALGKKTAFCEKIKEVHLVSAYGVFEYDVCYTSSAIDI